jgi:hypothetical protein
MKQNKIENAISYTPSGKIELEAKTNTEPGQTSRAYDFKPRADG